MTTFTWRVTCEKCGWTYPARELVAIKTDAEQNARDHKVFCTGKRPADRPAVHAAFCWCDGCQGKVAHPGGPDA